MLQVPNPILGKSQSGEGFVFHIPIVQQEGARLSACLAFYFMNPFVLLQAV